MPSISLVVTGAVKKQVALAGESQRQIAIRSPSIELGIALATAGNILPISICGVIHLNVGDNGAIWERHQSPGTQLDDFKDLYSLLARRPEDEITFRW